MSLLKLLLAVPHYLLFGLMGVLGIGFLIGIHELGHFLFAKLFNVHTPSFSIGFGPRIFSKQIGDTLFSLSAIPLGGYVEVSGMAELGQGEQKEAYDTGANSFATKPLYQKLIILFGGIFFNLLFAYISLSLLFMIGAPKTDLLYPLGIVEEQPIIRIIRKDTAAEKYGLHVGDEVIAVDETAVEDDVKKLKELIRGLPEKEVLIKIKRNNNELTLPITLDSSEITEDNKQTKIGTLGVFYEIKRVPEFSFFEAIKQGVRATNIYITMVLYGFKNMFEKRDITGVGGPIMVITETIKGAQKGAKVLALFLAVISINLAVLNLLPLPILDGGQIMFVTIEAVIGRQLPKLREYIHLISWFLILGLLIYLTLKDVGILKFFNLCK